MFLPLIAGCQAINLLAIIVGVQDFDRFTAKSNGAFSEPCFWSGKLDAVPIRPDKLTFDFDGLPDPIQVSPLKPKQFHLVCAGDDCQVEKRFPSMSYCNYQELADLAFIEDCHFGGWFFWRLDETGRVSIDHAKFCTVGRLMPRSREMLRSLSPARNR